MKRGRELKNLPVIEMNSGKQLGYVEDFHLESDLQNIAGIYVKTPNETLGYYPFIQIGHLGRDAVLVQGKPQAFEDKELTHNSHYYTNSLVMTVSGKNIGQIEDIVLEEKDGNIMGYEISDGHLKDILLGRSIIPKDYIRTLGYDTVLVEDNYLE